MTKANSAMCNLDTKSEFAPGERKTMENLVRIVLSEDKLVPCQWFSMTMAEDFRQERGGTVCN
jgi:hypothetical protein